MNGVRVERLDHLELLTGTCQEIEILRQQQVSVGTATVAMIVNGLGFSNRRLLTHTHRLIE